MSAHLRSCEECDGHGALALGHPDDPSARERACPHCDGTGRRTCEVDDCCVDCQDAYEAATPHILRTYRDLCAEGRAAQVYGRVVREMAGDLYLTERDVEIIVEREAGRQAYRADQLNDVAKDRRLEAAE